MAKKRARSARSDRSNLELVTNNQKAIKEGPKRKTWSHHDLKAIKPLTQTQHDMFQAWMEGDSIVAHGSAGTGKTFLAMFLALNELLEYKEQHQILIVRSAVPTRDVGFLPGTLEEKTALYELPYNDICHELVGRPSTYQDMKDAGVIEFMTTSFIRGLTWDNTIVIVEEVENMTFHEINSVMTRIGENSRVIFTGDLIQTDLDGSRKNGSCGMGRLLKIAATLPHIASIEFLPEDIVRSKFVKDWIIATQAVGE